MKRVIAILLGLLVSSEASFAQVRNNLSGPHVTVQTDGTLTAGEVNLMTSNAGPINFYTNKIKRGYIDGTTGQLTGFTFGSILLPNATYLQARNAANSANLNLLGAGSSDETRLISATQIQLAVGGGGGTGQWTIDSSKFAPVVNASEDIGSLTLAASNVFTRNVQADTANNLTLSARNGHVDFYTIAADSTPLKRWRVEAGSGHLQQDGSNGGALIMARSQNNTSGIIMGTTGFSADVTQNTQIYAITSSGTTPQLAIAQGTADTNGSTFNIFKSRSTDSTADTIVVSGDTIGRINFLGSNGSTFDTAAYIKATIDATPGASADMPGAVEIFVSPDGSATPVSSFKVAQNQVVSFPGTLNATRTTDIGWAVVAAAGVACNTACTNACVVGQNATFGLVSCATVVTGSCICAGGS